jgi:hypothetical protein
MTSTLPDWTAIDETIQCPLCAYNLRGLDVPRCPECGYRFEWIEVLDPSRRLHPFLFEHHPERNTETYIKTLLGGLRPRKFWRSLHPVQPSIPRRIILYWLIGTPLLVAAGMTCLLILVHFITTQNALRRPSYEANPRRFLSESFMESKIAEHGSMQRFFDVEMPTDVSGAMRFLVREPSLVVATLPYLIPLVWPWVTFACLLVFSESMARARINRDHVLRCVFYSSDVFVWLGVANLAIIALYWFQGGSGWLLSFIGLEAVFRAHCWAVAPFLILAWLRLWIAYRVYLRFRHATAVIGASALVVVLATAAFAGFLMYGW